MTEGSGDCYQDCYQNALAERLNGILQDEFLFLVPRHLPPARRLVAQDVPLYKNERPHRALDYRTPNQVHPQAKSPAGKSGQGSCLFSVNV
jgi:putative transposase